MYFDLTEEQELLQETVRGFLANECGPNKLREIFDGPSGHDAALWQGMLGLGLGGIFVPDEYGGAGLELLDLALVAEVLGAAATPGPFLGHALAVLAILRGGSDAQRKHWLPKLIAGEKLATVALAEAGGGWQPDEWTLAPGARLSGAKRNVPFASVADLLVVGTAGGGLALVESGGGVSCKSMRGADRTRRIDEVAFENAAAEALPRGTEAAAAVRDVGLVLLAADAYGGAKRCLDMAVEYAKTREQFGVTIGHFQALKHQLANVAIDVEPCRALYWYAAHALDHIPGEAPRAAAVAKSHVTDRFMHVARETVEAHGGIGFTWECDVQIYYKRAMFDRAFLGVPAVHRERAAVLAGW